MIHIHMHVAHAGILQILWIHFIAFEWPVYEHDPVLKWAYFRFPFSFYVYFAVYSLMLSFPIVSAYGLVKEKMMKLKDTHCFKML